MSDTTKSDCDWLHPWLMLELATHAVTTQRLEKGAGPERERALILLIRKRQQIERV